MYQNWRFGLKINHLATLISGAVKTLSILCLNLPFELFLGVDKLTNLVSSLYSAKTDYAPAQH
jgi:hypothetical protein